MINNTIIVPISEAESDYLEKLQYEFNVRMNILHYLMKKGDVSDDIIDRYNSRAETSGAELEIAKSELSNKYIPDSKRSYNFSIDFKNHTISYTEVIEKG